MFDGQALYKKTSQGLSIKNRNFFFIPSLPPAKKDAAMADGGLHLQLSWGSDTLHRDCDTGWLVLYQGAAWSSIATELYTRSKYSHVGIIVRLFEGERFAYAVGPALLVWEVVRGTHRPCLDLLTNTPRSTGPRLVSLAERMANNHDELAIDLLPLRFLSVNPPPAEQRRTLRAQLLEFFQSRVDWSFDDSPLTLFKAAYDGIGGTNEAHPHLHAMFCSDGVARALKHCGLLRADENTREITPADFLNLKLIGNVCEFELPPRAYAQSLQAQSPLEWQLCVPPVLPCVLV